MEKVFELEKQLEELKLNIEKEKLILQKQKLSHTSLSHERDRKLLRGFLPKVVEENVPKFQTLDTSYVQFLVEEESFVSLKKNFEGIKEGQLTVENISNKTPCRLEISSKNFRIVLEHVRSGMKLKSIGIPDELDDRLKLLQDVRKLQGLDKLQKRLEVLCFIQSLDNEDSTQKEYRIMQDLDIMKHEMKLLRKMSEKQHTANQQLEKELTSGNKLEKKEDFGTPIILYVGGDSFPCYINQCIKPYENSRFVKLIKDQENSNDPIFIDRDKRMFKKVHDFVYSPSDFLSSPPVSFDERSLFNETMEYLLSSTEESIISNPFYLSGEDNLRMTLEEDIIREMFIKDRNHKLLDKKDILLLSIFDSDPEKFKKLPNDKVDPLPFLFDVESEPNQFLPLVRSHVYLPPVVDSISDFQRNFKTFTSHLLEGLDFSNLFVAGGSVLANVLDYSVENSRVQKKAKNNNRGKKSRFMSLLMNQQQQRNNNNNNQNQGNLDKINNFENALNSFKVKERLTNFSESSLDPINNSKYVSLLNVPVSPLLLKRLLSLRADIASASGFKKSEGRKYNDFEVPESMQFLEGLMFEQNKFSFQSPLVDEEVIFRFICGSPTIPEHFKMIPKDLYPIGLSGDLKYLFFTTLSTPFEQDFPIYVLPKDGPAWDPIPFSGLISQLSPVDEILDDPDGMIRRHRHFSKSDIDVFVYGTSIEEARKKVSDIYDTIMSNIRKQEGTIRDVLVIRTSYSVTFQFHKRRPIQLILRLYKSPTEILSGFDIDSCCIGYDGKKVFCLPRFRRALTQRYNLINVERQSTTYCLRLYKYARRGFRVAIPGYSSQKVKREGLLMSDLSQTKWKQRNKLFTDPEYLNTCGLARLIVLEGKMRRKMKSYMAILDRSDYDGAFLTIPSRLRRANPRFVYTLLMEKELELQKKMKMLVEYAGYRDGTTWKSPMIYSLNSITNILENEKPMETQVPRNIEFLTKNPGRQEKVTGSFRPIKANFFSGAYLSYSELIKERWEEDLGRFQWWYSPDNGNTLAAFSKHQNSLMEEARIVGKLNTLSTKSLIVDFEQETCFFIKEKENMKKYKIFRLKDFRVPK